MVDKLTLARIEMIPTWLGITAYFAGAISTACLLVKWEGMDTDDFGDMGAVMLVAILWPVFLPITVCVAISRMARRRP